jgi:hypothetical protein
MTMMSLAKYWAATASYAAARNVVRLHDARLETPYEFRKNIESRPMLIVEKIGITAICALYSPVLAPLWLWRDLGQAEAHVRGVDPALFGYGGKPLSTAGFLFVV